MNPPLAAPARGSFAQRCGVHDLARQQACDEALSRIRDRGLGFVRIGWCDVHGLMRSKTLTPLAAARALTQGIGLVSTLLLKDSSDRTAYPVFAPGGTAALPGIGQANNLVGLPDPHSLVDLPWVERTGWMRADLWHADAQPVAIDPRRVLERSLERLQHAGYGLRCGLELEFHIYRITDTTAQLDPAQAAWPGEPPAVQMIHPGYSLLNEAWADMAEPALRIVHGVAQGLGLPLLSLEAEMGPSQVEAVFDVSDALTAADQLALFRNAVRQALRRAGYHASFMCRPPFANVMSSGWHLHQSWVDRHTGRNVFGREQPAAGATLQDAGWSLSDLGEHVLAGLLWHAPGCTLLCTPTANGYARFRPQALAPQAVLWGRDNRGAMLRVIGEPGDESTHLENRLGEAAANPYLYLASQVEAGLDGLCRQLRAPPATDDPYGAPAAALPRSLDEAIAAFLADEVMVQGISESFARHLVRLKRAEAQRFEQAQDKDEFQRREYFGRL
ncbi:MAG: glutamine synthetase [Rubrivivax sp.]|nr:glutamine synthetase [Rubrivivax sp.]